jgi:alpha-beta hydrolase superfamily lysophospholipase
VTAVAYEEGSFLASGGVALFRRSWRVERPTAALINVHGLGDHSGLYAPLTESFAREGIAVHGLDLRGHGRSPGPRAYVGGWDDYLDDLGAFARWVTDRESGLPLFVLGHSLGGLIALDYAIHRPDGLAGVIAAAPPLGEVGVPPVLMTLGRVMARVWPRFSLNVGMDLTGLSRNPAVVETIIGDPLFHRKGTARLAVAVPDAIARAHRDAGKLRIPALLLHGTADRMVPLEGTRAFHARLVGDAELRVYDGAYHAIFFDDDGERVMADVVRWIRDHGG